MGAIEEVHPNGCISYQACPCHADGRPKEHQEDFVAGLSDRSKVSGEGDSKTHDGNNDDDSDDTDNEPEVVLGKGFDYVDSSDDKDWGGDGDSCNLNGMDDFDELVAREEYTTDPSELKDQRPNNFSEIQLSTEAERLQHLNSIKVTIKAGECLYLPAGWFHNVTSYGGNPTDDSLKGNDAIHMAINYWFYPPDNLQSYHKPYEVMADES